jgi:hypothetical protein
MFKRSSIAAAAALLFGQPVVAQDIFGSTPTPLEAAGFTAAWSAAGSTGVTDDRKVRFLLARALIDQNAPPGTRVVLRYTIPPFDDVNFPCTRLGVILRDPGPGQVDVRLMRIKMLGGGVQEIPLNINSDEHPASLNFVTREATMTGSPFNFAHSLYYIEVHMIKGEADSPSVFALYIGKPRSSTFCPGY